MSSAGIDELKRQFEAVTTPLPVIHRAAIGLVIKRLFLVLEDQERRIQSLERATHEHGNDNGKGG